MKSASPISLLVSPPRFFKDFNFPAGDIVFFGEVVAEMREMGTGAGFSGSGGAGGYAATACFQFLRAAVLER